MAKKMRKGKFDEQSERVWSESARKGADFEMFWTAKRSAFPTLASIYLKLIVSPASSSIVESSFLFLKNLKTGRTQLTDDHADDLLQLFFDTKIL